MKPEHRYALKFKLGKLWYEGWVRFDRQHFVLLRSRFLKHIGEFIFDIPIR